MHELCGVQRMFLGQRRLLLEPIAFEGDDEGLQDMHEMLFDTHEVIVHGAPGRLWVPGFDRVDQRTMLAGSIFHPSWPSDANVSYATDQRFHLEKKFQEPAVARHQKEVPVDGLVCGN